jgi:Ni/Co efflux regulator RcnB
MKDRMLTSSLVALSVSLTATLLGGLAHAQGDGDLAAQEAGRRQMDRQMRRITRERCPGHASRGRDQRFNRDERGAGPDRDFRRGDCLPLEYRNRNYVVDDWRRHRLDAPPAGYEWVQLGGDYVLVARDSGLIRQLRLNN